MLGPAARKGPRLCLRCSHFTSLAYEDVPVRYTKRRADTRRCFPSIRWALMQKALTLNRPVRCDRWEDEASPFETAPIA